MLDLVGGFASQPDRDESDQEAPRLPQGGENLERVGIHVASLGDAGDMLDDQAKLAYRRRLSDLREELEEAKELGNVERAERAEAEIDALTQELSRAVGLGGRNRRAASASERARQTVTKTIRAVLERITENDAMLGDVLSRCVRTGTFCSYQPDPNFPIAWKFAEALFEPLVAVPQGSNDDSAPAPADRPRVSQAVLQEMGKIIDELLRNAVAKVLLLWIAALVDKRQYRYRRNIRKGRRWLLLLRN